jgi:hypothetical protein
MSETPTAPPVDALAQLETARAECAGRVADAGVVVQRCRDRVAQLTTDHRRLNQLLAVAQAQSEAASVLAYEEVLENADADLKEIARSLNAATGPEALILQTRAHLIYHKIPGAQENQLRTTIELRAAEWHLAELDAQIHETKLITALAGALLLESDLEVTGAASRRHADLVALRGEAHRQSEQALRDFLEAQAKLRQQRVQAGILTK